jgi:hypothetical protein
MAVSRQRAEREVAGARKLRMWTQTGRWALARRWIAGPVLFCSLLAAVILLLAAAHAWAPPPINEGQAARCYVDVRHAKLPMSLGCVMAAHETLAAGLIAAAAALFAAWLAFNSLKEQIAISERNTRLLQRAYISIEPLGINPWRSPATGAPCNVVGHVQCRNTGRLPARNFKLSTIGMKWVADDRIEKERPPKVEEVEEYEQAIPIQATVTVGSAGLCREDLERMVDKKGYLLVWGKATYTDGFGTPRSIEFCHRYPCIDCTGDTQKGYSIGTANVRYHNHGNEQD